jgi:hypothetical protein
MTIKRNVYLNKCTSWPPMYDLGSISAEFEGSGIKIIMEGTTKEMKDLFPDMARLDDYYFEVTITAVQGHSSK